MKNGLKVSVFDRWRVVSLVLAILFLFNSARVLAKGDVVGAALYIKDPYAKVYVADVNKETKSDILSYESNIIRFSNADYVQFTAEQKRDWMEKALTRVRNSQLGKQNKYKVFNFIAEQDSTLSDLARKLSRNVQADVFTAWDYISPYVPVINTLLGVLIMLLLLSLTVSTVVDIMFLGETIFISWLLIKTGKNRKDNRPWFISKSAWKAYNDTDTSSQAVVKYAIASWWRWLALSIIIYLIITGSLFHILLIISDMFTI